MAQKFSNNGSTVIVNGISDNDTTILVTAATGELFPTININDDNEWSMCTLEDQFGNHEIVKAIGRTGDNFTVERGAEGTTAIAFASGARFELRATAGTLDNFIQRLGDSIDGRNMQIIINHDDTPGGTPPSLAEGELFLDTALGKLWYGDDSVVETVLAQEMYIASTGAPPLNPFDGAFWYQTDTHTLHVYYNAAWRQVTFTDNNGQATAPFHLSLDGTDYISAANDEVAGAAGVSFMGDNVTIDSSGNTIIKGTFTQEGDATFKEAVTFEKAPSAPDYNINGTGAVLRFSNPSWDGGVVHYSTESPGDPADYKEGDLWVQLGTPPPPLP